MSVNFDSEEYELIDDDREINLILAELPIDLIKENLKEQIKDPMVTNVDHLEVVIDKYEFIIQNYSDDTEGIQELNRMIIELCTFVINEICNEYNVSVDYDDESMYEVLEMTNSLYEGLVLSYKENIAKFFFNYIMHNKQTLVEALEVDENVKEATNSAIKKGIAILDRGDLVLMMNLPTIYKTIYENTLEIDPDYFIKVSGMASKYYGAKLLDKFEAAKIVGTFVPVYMNMLVDEYDNVKQEIFNIVRNKLCQLVTTSPNDVTNSSEENK